MLKRFFRLKVAVPVAAVVLAAGGLLAIPAANAFTPPSFDDTRTGLIDTRGFRRLGATNAWSCGGGCVAARTGGAARRGCAIYTDAPVSGAVRAASDACVVALQALCTGAAVDDCASTERF